MPINYAQYLARFLADTGIRHLPAVYGLAELPLMSAVQAHGAIRVLRTHNESMAAAIASAIAIRTGIPQVTAVTTGVGLTNLATGLYEAAARQAPLVAIACITATARWGTEAPQRTICGAGVDGVDPVKIGEGAGAKRVFLVPTAAAGPGITVQAFRLACAQRCGPVLLAIPENVFSEPIDPADAAQIAFVPLEDVPA